MRRSPGRARQCGTGHWPCLKLTGGRARVRARCVLARAEEEAADTEVTKLQQVDKVISAKLVFDDEDGSPDIRYLARWKDDGAMTWEPSDNMSEDLLRDFEESFWQACKTADMDTLEPALQYGGDTAANLTDADKRCPLHFAAATNRKALIERLFKAGALANPTDKEGYTPLHMAAGYLHSEACASLLAGGADPSRRDRQGRDVPDLLDSLRDKMTSAQAGAQRMRLEEVSKSLIYFEFEDVAPAALLNKRTVDGAVQYLVSWRDDVEDSWVPASLISDEVVQDYEAGIEYAEAERITAARVKGDAKEYLVQWADGKAASWESEDNVRQAMVLAFEKESRGREQRGASDATPCATERREEPVAA